ncbi:MAG: hypothetical protein HYW24_00780 [Candidatus Aenigmarchaeota archaeon]|nr:hypothetical protein [Candidatus Aenigmarchaeota archaeon]
MDTQKILKPNNKIVILADYREREVIDHLEKMGAVVNKMNLKVGDFICSSNRIAIERKTHSDFVSSIIDGRIFEQMNYMKENFEKPLVIVEGYSNRNINENAFKATVASMITKFGVSLVSTMNSLDTAKMIYWIAKKEQETGYDLGFKHGKKPRNDSDLQEFILSSIPGISKILARRLLENFGNIENVVNAQENELGKIKGVGKKHAQKIKKLLTDKYTRVLD